MVNYKNPAIELMPDPVALDLAIQTMQEKLAAGLPWLQKAFGRAMLQPQQVPETEGRQARDILVPITYNGDKREPISLMPNPSWGAYCFFYPRDPLKFAEWDHLPRTNAEQPMTIYCWVDLSRIDKTKPYNFSETLRMEMLKVLKRCPGFVPQESSVQPDAVFRPFTITDTFRQYMLPPYAAFRIDGTLHFDYFDMTNCYGDTSGPTIPTVTNWTGISYDQLSGVLTFEGAQEVPETLTRTEFLTGPGGYQYQTQEGAYVSIGPFPGASLEVPFFRPGSVHVRWQRIGNTAELPELTPWQETTINVTRLPRRWLKVWNVTANSEVMPGFNPVQVLNINGAVIPEAAIHIQSLTYFWNGDFTNADFGEIVATRTAGTGYYEAQVEPLPEITTYPITRIEVRHAQ